LGVLFVNYTHRQTISLLNSQKIINHPTFSQFQLAGLFSWLFSAAVENAADMAIGGC